MHYSLEAMIDGMSFFRLEKTSLSTCTIRGTIQHQVLLRDTRSIANIPIQALSFHPTWFETRSGFRLFLLNLIHFVICCKHEFISSFDFMPFSSSRSLFNLSLSLSLFSSARCYDAMTNRQYSTHEQWECRDRNDAFLFFESDRNLVNEKWMIFIEIHVPCTQSMRFLSVSHFYAKL